MTQAQALATIAPAGRFILLVEDNPGDARLTRELLAEALLREAPELVWVSRMEEAITALSERAASCSAIVLDLGLPDSQGLQTLRAIRPYAGNCPVVVLTGDDDDNVGLAAVTEGAQDFLVKGSFDAGALRRSIGFARQRLAAEQALVQRALHDDLTGLPRRALLMDRLEAAILRCARAGSEGALMFVDIDHFKQTNDVHGHAAGDAVLQAVAARLTATLRGSDTAARLGGDEFVVLLSSMTSADEAMTVAHKVHQALAQPLAWQGRSLDVSASMGVVRFGGGDGTADQVMARADAAMYQAKAGGRGRVRLLDDGPDEGASGT